MAATTVREIMTKNVINMQVSTTLEEAARAMREQDIGNVVVAEDERLVGLVTDRDIVIRAVADGMDPTTTTLGSVTSRDIIAIQPDDTAQAAALLMREQAILTNATCVYPHCSRPSRSADLDHVENWDGTNTTSTNLAPLCRSHHRYKTHGGWTITRTGPTSFTWTSPYGYSYDWDTTHTSHTRHMR